MNKFEIPKLCVAQIEQYTIMPNYPYETQKEDLAEFPELNNQKLHKDKQ